MELLEKAIKEADDTMAVIAKGDETPTEESPQVSTSTVGPSTMNLVSWESPSKLQKLLSGVELVGRE